MQFHPKSALALVTLAALGLAAHPASAQGSLSGAYYHPPSITTFSLADAQSYMDSHGPSGYFTSTQTTLADVGYHGHDGTAIKTFLGTDGASFVGTNDNLSDGILNLTGSVSVAAPGTFTFTTTSDDGSALYIDGAVVVNNDGLHTTKTVTATKTLSAGTHSVSVLYFDRGLLPLYNGDANFSASFGGLTVSSAPRTSAVLPTPEPSSVAAFAFTGLGALGLILKARRRTLA